MSIAERARAIRASLPERVVLVAVSKTQPARAIREAYAAGLRHFGENYAQEWRSKAAELADLPDLCWHFVGGLQTNKVRMLLSRAEGADPVPRVAWIHTVDRESLALEISRRAQAAATVVRALIEVNVAGETTKAGCPPGDVPALADRVSKLPGLALRGLMCIPPSEADPRPHFSRMRRLAESLGLPDLSMGMSGDYPAAVEEGATLVRIGTALFGPR